ncbi:O-antigen polymerase [Photobacterium phosphoreum]|uniref:O-antigen polymerase n=1 Tax=Photobacterium phosphoreum TaxID=659 RepID=UPI001E529FD4|nr:O-antigen polymerase [Photobacterium phosphoreum]MCD9477844.1 oligosaccharide repeat unit polymerase [Photobacterium phosphoreum]
MFLFSSKSIDFFDIKYLFVFLTIYFTLIPFLFTINIQTFLTLLVVIIGFFSFLLGYKTKKRILIISRANLINNNFIFQSIGLFFLLNDLFFGVINLTSIKNIDGYTESFMVNDHDSLYLQILSLSVYYIKYYFYALIMAKNRYFFFLVFISQIFISFNSPIRLFALSPLIILTIYGYYMGYIKVNIKRIICVFILSPIVFVVLLLSRTATNGMNYFEIVSKVVDNLDYESFIKILKTALESFKSFEYLNDIIYGQFVHLESGIVRILFMPISRDFWLDKPDSISRIIAQQFIPEQYSSGGGSVATIYGDAFINGHLPGVIILMFIVGYISKIIYNTMVKSKILNSNQKSIIVLFYSLYIFQFLYFFRGFLSESYWKVILMFFIFFILYKIQFKLRLNSY